MAQKILAGSGERMQYLTHEFNDNTMRFVLRYPGRLDAARLAEATLKLVNSVEILHARFVCGKVHAYWLVQRDLTAEDCFCLVETEKDPMEEAKTIAAQPVPADGRAKILCTLVQAAASAALVLRISHLCCDGADGTYLLGKLAQAYADPAAPLQVKNGNRAPEQMYEHLSDEEKKALMRNPLSGVKSAFPYPEKGRGAAQICVQIIPADVMSAARQRAKEVQATANDLLLAACYHAYAALPGVDAKAPMSVLGMMDLRKHCRNMDALGLSNMTGSLPTVLQEGIGGTFAETLARVAEQTARAKEDPYAGIKGLPLLHMGARRVPMALLLKIAGKAYGGMGFGLTNIGNLDLGRYVLGGVRPTGGWFGGPVKKKPAMQIAAASFDGACALSISADFVGRDVDALKAFLNAMAEQIEHFAE